MKALFFVALCYLTVLPQSLMGQGPVFDNQIIPDTAYWSDGSSIFQDLADNFTLNSNTTITGIEFTGIYGNSVVNDIFEIELYMDNGGMPELNSFLTTQLTNTQRTATGDVIVTATQSFDLFSYTADLTAAINLDANTDYWIRIANDTNGEFWNWAALSSGNDGIYFRNDTDPDWTFFNSDMDFTLIGTTSIPEPSSIFGLLGLAIAVNLRRRRF